MKKQTIIITGGSSCIGKATARLFLRNGDNVVLNLSEEEFLADVFSELSGGDNLAMVGGKISDRVTGIKLLANALGRFGSVDVLVNNAGEVESRPFFQIDESFFDQIVESSLKGAFFATQAIIPQMLKQDHGIIINIETPLISHSKRDDTILPIPKGIMHSLSLQLGAEFGNDNIKFNTITPGKNKDINAGREFFDDRIQLEIIAKMVYDIAKGNTNPDS